jgi:hypothetical protein
VAQPSGADYQITFQNPRSAFLDPDLQQARPAKTRLGLPNLMSGNFAVVCHMSGAGGTWAVRAFVHDVPDLQYRYQLISSCLDGRRGEISSFVGFRYVPDGIKVNGQIHPIVVMDWVPGIQLDRAIDQRVRVGQDIGPLIEGWLRLVAELEGLQVAHGDLQHGNILVDGDRIRLVDYDGMFVPAMAGMSFSEQGHANYQHPQRRAHGFNADLDRFSALLIFTALRALHHDPGLWQRTGTPNDNLLFLKRDLDDPTSSPVFAELAASGDPEVRLLAEVIKDSLLTGDLPPPISHLLGSRPTVTSSTTDTTGWWKASQPAPASAERAAPFPHQQAAIGTGWIRAFVGSSVGVPSGDSFSIQPNGQRNSLLDQVPYVASFNRPFVHRSTCDWAQQIATRNLIGFVTLDEAYASGYKPCKTCKPQQLRQEDLLADSGAKKGSAPHGAQSPSSGSLWWGTRKVREHIQAPGLSSSTQASIRVPSRESIRVGSQVKLQYPKGKTTLVRMVRAGSPTPTLSHIQEDSALGRAIMGKEAGEEVTYREMGKVFKFTILEVI